MSGPTPDQLTAQQWAGRWRTEYERCAAAETKLARIEALCEAEEAQTAEHGQGVPVLFVSDIRAALNE